MRVLGLVLMFALATTGTALAEKVKTNQETRVLNHPGEQGKLVVKVKEGQSMTLLGSEGRWLKVRVQGRTGWVPRSKVEMADPDEVTRNTRRRPFVDGRSTKRGFGSQEAPDDRIGADAVNTEGGEDTSTPTDDTDTKPGKKPGKKPAKTDDDEDTKPTAKKPGKKPGKTDDDEEDTKPAAKPAAKPVAKPTAKPSSDDDDDEEDTKPAAKPIAKPVPVAKPVAKPAAKPSSDDDDEEAKPAKGATHDDDENPIKGAASAKKPASDDEEDTGASAPAAEKRAKAHVAAKAKVFGDRDEASDVEFTAKPGDVLYPTETKGNWTKVETDEGDEGWILSDNLEVDGGSSGGGSHGRSIGINVGLGIGYLTQGMVTTGTTKTGADQVPDVYTIGTSAATLALGGNYFTHLGAKYLVGVDGGLVYSKTIGGGISYMKTVTGISIADFTLRGSIGYPTTRPSGLTLLARLGYRYRNYAVDNYKDPAKNPARIPQEILSGPTLGFAVAMPTLTHKLGLVIGLDAMLFGAGLTQTVGLEDGASAGVTVLNLNAGLVYAWKPGMNLVFSYDLDHGSYDFGSPTTATMSTRGHTGTDVTRSDTLHNFGVTVAKSF